MSRLGPARASVGGWVRGRLVGAAQDDPTVLTASTLAPGEHTYAIAAPPPSATSGDPTLLAVPPSEVWELPDEHERGVYLRSGEEHAQKLGAALTRHGCEPPSVGAVLDFGCGYGRVTRWLPTLLTKAEVWGTDLDATAVEWARQNLGNGPRFASSGPQPHLPFADCSFDVVHAGSVLPHIADGADGWMLELRRVTRPGGLLYVTVYDEATADRIRRGLASPQLRSALDDAEATHGRLGEATDVLALSRRPGSAQVFRSRRWIERVWGAWFDIVAFEADAFHIQTAVMLRASGERRPA